MKTFNRILVFVLVVLQAAACSTAPMAVLPTQAPAVIVGNPYGFQSGDSGMMRGDIKLDSATLSMTTSQPPHVLVNFAYFQPTPCYHLRVEVGQPDAQKRINLNAYAVAEKDKPCALMALATPLQASLNLGSFPKGHYSLWLNGQQVGEFDS